MSGKEKMTLRYHKETAKILENNHSDFNFWKEDFENFKHYLPRGRVIDIGCGGGKAALLFQEKPLYSYVAINVPYEMIIEARKLALETIFLEMNIYKLNFAEDRFEGFWAVDSFMHISKKRYLKIFQRKINIALGQIRKIIKPNGFGFIAIKEGKGEKMVFDKKGNARLDVFYGNSEFIKILKECGFTVLNSRTDFERDSMLAEEQTIWLKYFVQVRK